MPREEPPRTSRTPRARSAWRSSRQPPEAPARPAGSPGWLAFIAGAALTVLAYGALRDPKPARAPVKTATNAVRPAAARWEQAEPAERAGSRAPAHPAPTPLGDLDAAARVEEPPADDSNEPERTEEPAATNAETSVQPDAGALAATPAPVQPALLPVPALLPIPVLPPDHPPLDKLSASDPPGSDDLPGSEEAPAEEASRTTIRHVEVTVISRWQQPGMCERSASAAAARRTMMTRFQRFKWEPDAVLFLDPRLPFGTQRNLLPQLEAAERELAEQLDLHPTRPDVFAYRDTQLLLAGSCTNKNVVAYYDGDLHVVPTHADVQQSITHEYTHHALMTSGLIAPAWAQEGIAMNVARETWWQTSDWLDRVAARPYSIEIMERTVPYTMTSEQSLAFYVQSAAMVWCSTIDDPEGLRGLVRKLSSSGGSLEYELPALAEPSGLRACAREILSAASEAE